MGRLKPLMVRQPRIFWRKNYIFIVALALLLALPFIFTAHFQHHVMIKVLMFAFLGCAWNIIGGYTGQIALGHAAFFGIGAYTSSLCYIWFGLNPWLGMLLGGILAVAVSAVINYPCFRLHGRYFAIATLALGMVIRLLFTNWRLVGGALGVRLPLLPESLWNFQFHTTKLPYYYITLVLCALIFALVYKIERSKLGFYLRAIKESEEAARSLGIDVAKYKLVAMSISVFFTAMAGTIYAQYILYIDPISLMPLMTSILICVVPVVGGAGTLWGPALGAPILLVAIEYSRAWLGGGGRGVDYMIVGAIMVAIIFRPAGLISFFQGPRFRQWWRRIRG